MSNKHSFIPQNINKAFRRQTWFTCVAYTTYFLFGIMRGYPTFLLQQLTSKDSPIPVSPQSWEVSWIASLSIFTNPFGSVIAGYLMDKYGRKMTLQLSVFLFTAGWTFVMVSQNLTTLSAGILIIGVAIGMGACSTIYVAEICEAQNRCMLLSFLEIFFSLGIVAAYILTCYLGWRAAASIFTLFSLVSMWLLLYIPETPYWLIKQNHTVDAMRSLVRLRGHQHPDRNQHELTTLVMSLHGETKQQVGILAIVGNWKPFVILVLFHLLLQGTGYTIILTYLTQFLEYFDVNEHQNAVAIGYSVASFVASFVTPASVNFWPRRPSTMLSGAGIAATLVTLGSFGVYSSWQPNASRMWFVVPVCLCLYVLSSTIGVLTLSQAMISELYPTEVRGVMSGLTEALGTALSGLAVITYLMMVNYNVNCGEMMFIFAFFGVLTVLFGKFVLPETHGKSLTEIQSEYFKKRREPLETDTKIVTGVEQRV